VSATISRGVVVLVIGLRRPPAMMRVRWTARVYNHGSGNHGSHHRIAYAAKDENSEGSDSNDQTAHQQSEERVHSGT